MAQATVTLKVYPFPQGLDTTQRRLHVNGPVAVSASPGTYVTGGLPLSWTSLTDSLTGAAVPLETSATKPFIAWFQSLSGSGYAYGYNFASNTFQIFTGAAAQSPLNELTTGATIPAAVSGDTITFEAEFLKSI